ncbi:site-specific integrase [Aquitalea aquatica]|uniref:Tyrosine-type recombinase/integrase n=1 Tax=Aquitalea aquatica TaxID=3044273 RepID=A0A838Y9K4_9NEIS|nr:site-specific integrase [Aquitalea magnusonii]MBA4709229.1 tyrosine-type recombinase/integrase [Aquitalea magnusonii]
MQKNYQIKSFVMLTGERYCLLIDRETGMPLYYPNLYVTTQVRNRSNSVASMESALSGINVLLRFCEEHQVDLEGRFMKCEYFAIHELDAIRDYCQQSFTRRAEDPRREVIPINSKGKPTRKTGLASEYVRLTHIAKYTAWLATILLTGEIERKTTLDIAKMKKGFESRRPSSKGRNQAGREQGLSREQEMALLEVIQPGYEHNPFEDQPTQIRNQLLILLLLYLGIRGGELLNIRVSDIDWSKNQIVIARRADAKIDPRRRQPLVKTLDRRLPMKDTLVRAIHHYIVQIRSRVPGAKKHDYLFVTHKSGPTQGQPMSRSAFLKVIKLISSATPKLSGLHGHELRHTWNNRFSELMDARDDPPTPEEQEMQRSYLQGWKPGSGTAAIYTKRFTREKAIEASLKLQEGMTRIPENLEYD